MLGYGRNLDADRYGAREVPRAKYIYNSQAEASTSQAWGTRGDHAKRISPRTTQRLASEAKVWQVTGKVIADRHCPFPITAVIGISPGLRAAYPKKTLEVALGKSRVGGLGAQKQRDTDCCYGGDSDGVLS